MTEYTISNFEKLDAFAKQVLKEHISSSQPENQAKLITLSGNLGAGKTTLTQRIGALLEISDEINSPTYVIEQRYLIEGFHNFTELVHIDAYRLEQEEDPVRIGLDETIQDPTKIIIIEWPEKIADFLQDYTKIEITLSLEGEVRNAFVK